MEPLWPVQQLEVGAQVLLGVLSPAGFRFEPHGSGVGSGGAFAWGEFTRENRRLEIHFRLNLGEVQYHSAGYSVRHEPYMRKLGVWSKCRYPGFSSSAPESFHDLAHDLRFAQEFLIGGADALVAAALEQKVQDDAKNEALLAGYQGQTRQVAEMRALFKEGKYAAVVALFNTLPAPHLLSDTELRLVDIARRRDA